MLNDISLKESQNQNKERLVMISGKKMISGYDDKTVG